jgi:hypothetical protein
MIKDCCNCRLIRSLAAVFGFWLAAGVVTPAGAHDLAGRWDGSWASQVTPHHGTLHGKFRRVDASHYRVVFTGRFFRVIPFRYAVKLNIVCEGPGTVQLAGSSKLLGFGEFRYHAVVNGDSFVASYHAKKDHGQFILQRRCP